MVNTTYFACMNSIYEKVNFFKEWKTNHKRGSEHTDTVLFTRETRDPGGKPSPKAGIKHKVRKVFEILLTQCHVLQSVCVFHVLQSVCVFSYGNQET